MTTNTTAVKACALFETMMKPMMSLYDRWQDEHEYEDFNDYADLLKKEVELRNGVFVKATKRPFGFHFKVDDRTYAAKINAHQYSYVRIA